MGMWRDSLRRTPPIRFFLVEIQGLDHAEGRPHASWLRQVEAYLKDTGMAGLVSAWAMARRRPSENRRKVDAATRCSGVRLEHYRVPNRTPLRLRIGSLQGFESETFLAFLDFEL